MGASRSLLEAVAAGNYEAVQDLLAQHGDKLDLEVSGYAGQKPLHIAAWRGDLEIVEILLQNGADPNSVDNYDSTPLFDAAVSKKMAIIKMLLEAGADPSHRNLVGQTPQDFNAELHKLHKLRNL